MLDKIKSKYIFKKVFSVLREKKVLQIANYKKSFQNILGNLSYLL